MDRWIITAEGFPPMRPFMCLELEQEDWAFDMEANMVSRPERWRNVRVWHYRNGVLTDVSTASPPKPRES